MRTRRHISSVILPAMGMLLLILDSKTAIQGAADGINLCIYSVIPSLFPFFALSILLTNNILSSNYRKETDNKRMQAFAHPSISLFAVGLLGGYPTGAQAVTEAYHNGYLSRKTACRLLGFCSNAGPAFIFGFAGQLFSVTFIPWLLWLIHIISALAVSRLIPITEKDHNRIEPGECISLQQAFSKSLHAIASVCGWIILFRVLIAFFDRWFFWLLPATARILFSGLLELANGIVLLKEVESEAVRFICCSILLAFGGCCVGMQTSSVTKELGTGWYFPGKLLQSAVSGILSIPAVKLIYGYSPNMPIHVTLMIVAALIVIFCIAARKIPIAFLRENVYNNQKHSRELSLCSFEKR